MPADPFYGLELLDGPRAGERVPMLRTQLEIGHAVWSGLSLPQAGLERRHCLIRRDRGRAFTLVSYRRGCGTTLNGQVIHHQALRPGDVIGLGKQKLLFAEGVQWDPDADAEAPLRVTELAGDAPGSLDQIERALSPLTHRLRGLCMLAAAEMALPVWRQYMAGRTIEYHDGVVGMFHQVDAALPEQAVAHVRDSLERDLVRPCYQVADGYAEPIVAMQDDDLDLPYPQEMSFYGIYNMFEVFCGIAFPARRNQTAALSIHQCLVGHLFSLSNDPPASAVRAAFGSWWARCQRAQAQLHRV